MLMVCIQVYATACFSYISTKAEEPNRLVLNVLFLCWNLVQTLKLSAAVSL